MNTVKHAILGGIGAELGGGKFANGAVTGAFGYLFNHLAHVGVNIRVPAWAGKLFGGAEYQGQGGGFGLALSWPGDQGGEFDVGVYGQVNGSGFDYGTGRGSVGIGYEQGGLRDGLRGWGIEASFNDGVGGLSTSFNEKNRLTGVGIHVGPGYNVGASVTKTGVLSLRDGFDLLFDRLGSRSGKR